MGANKPKDENKEKPKEEKKKEVAKPVKMERPKSEAPRTLVRVANTDLDGEKPLIRAMGKVKGISNAMARAVCLTSGLDQTRKLGSLNEAEIKALEEIIADPIKFGIPNYLVNRRKDYETGKDMHLTGSDFDVARKFDIQRLVDMRSYKGWRHMLGQPVRGQRTKAHFRGGTIVGVMRKAIKLQMAAGKEGEKKEEKKEEKK